MMWKQLLLPCALVLLILESCAGRKPHADSLMPLAFPGAEGFGKYATGGRGGKTFVVTNLNDAGKGSFREAATSNGARVIVFSVSGTIHLESKLTIKGQVTIAGQTSPGGICLADYPVSLGGNNIIVRYLRFRMGDRYQNQGQIDGAGGDDAFGGTGRSQIIIDHCSMSWSTDEAFSVYGGDSTTLQWNLISEPLNYSFHFETGDKDFEHHGYGGIWGGKHTSAHHNLFAHCGNRTPRFDGERNIPEEFVDFRNNVIYNWETNNVYAGEGGQYNIVSNYYRPGPSTRAAVLQRLLNPYKKPPGLGYGRFYVNGNIAEGSPQVSANNWMGVTMNDGTAADTILAKAEHPFPAVAVATSTASAAYEEVLKFVGANLPVRDTLDARIIEDVKLKRGRIIDVQGGYPHGTPYEISKSAWPVLENKAAPADADQDGIADEWERKHGLNAADPADGKMIAANGVSNIENYINSLVR